MVRAAVPAVVNAVLCIDNVHIINNAIALPIFRSSLLQAGPERECTAGPRVDQQRVSLVHKLDETRVGQAFVRLQLLVLWQGR